MAINFDGRNIVHPGGYSTIDSNNMVVTSDGSTNIPIVLGTADAGKPGEVKWFTNMISATNYLRGGELLNALQLMFSPLPEGGGGSSMVGVVIVNPNTQATLVAGGVTFTSLEYGAGGNKVQVKLESGTISGSKKLTASRWDVNALEVFDNLGAVMSITYTGAQAYADVTITVNSGTATRLQTKVGASSATGVLDLDLNLADSRFATVDGIISYINSVSGYTAALLNPQHSGMASSGLDAVSAIAIKTTAANFMAINAGIKYTVNGNSNLVSLSIPSTATNFVNTYLGGAVTPVAPTSWATHLDTVKSSFSDVLVVLSGSASIHAEASIHLGQMELRKQRQVMFTGGASGENATQAKQRASALNNSRIVLAYPGIYHAVIGNGTTVLPPYMTAALIAGRATGVDPSEPITFDYFGVIGLEKDQIVGDPVIDDLIASGVCTLERTYTGGIRLVQGITTYLGTDNTLLKEISVRRGADKVDAKVVRALEDKFVGNKNLLASESAIKTAIIDVLEGEKRNGTIADYNPIIQLTYSGTSVIADYQVAPVEPVNFVLLRSHFVPASSLSTQ
jgi:hypothetical protein